METDLGIRQGLSTPRIMRIVSLALIPGLLVLSYYFGPGILINVVVSVTSAMAFEVMILKLRGREIKQAIEDGSALVTGMLIGLALPPLLPVWMILIATFFAVVIAKHLYGGLGHNLFNPAMTGYAVLIISFPVAMSLWTPADSTMDNSSTALWKPESLWTAKIEAGRLDAYSAATPLDHLKFRGALTIDELWQSSGSFGKVSGIAWEQANLAFLLGGLLLVYLGIASFRAPLAMLVTLSVLAGLFYDNGSSASLGAPSFHLFSGATMLTAFFIVTDPVTSPDSETGQILFGAGVGLLIFLIRSIGAFPDGAAFAVLLMNACSPLIDQLLIMKNK